MKGISAFERPYLQGKKRQVCPCGGPIRGEARPREAVPSGEKQGRERLSPLGRRSKQRVNSLRGQRGPREEERSVEERARSNYAEAVLAGEEEAEVDTWRPLFQEKEEG
jgi:hypothetical protein